MNRNGFTLIELLMVVILIGILGLILAPNILSMINKNDVKSCNSFKSNIISAAKMYLAENKYNMDFNCGSNKTKVILIDDLKEGDYLSDDDSSYKSFKYDTGETSIKVNVTYDCVTKTFSYEPNFKCNNE